MIARIIGGLSKANVAITLAIVSDTTTENERNRAMVSRTYERKTHLFLLRDSFLLISIHPQFHQSH
jgi:hypothetical protein